MIIFLNTASGCLLSYVVICIQSDRMLSVKAFNLKNTTFLPQFCGGVRSYSKPRLRSVGHPFILCERQ